MALRTDPNAGHLKLRGVRTATTVSPVTYVYDLVPEPPARPLAEVLPECDAARERLKHELEEHAREVPPASPIEAKLDTIIRQNDRILDLLEWKGPVR
jgi:hypothetical protein